MKFITIDTNSAPAIGIAVRLTTSTGETFEIPDTAMIAAVIGDMLLAIPAASCIGNNIIIGEIDILAATSGASAAKAKNGAFPDPMRMAEIAMINVIIIIITVVEKPDS